MNLLTPTFRVSYPNVFEPKLNKLSNQKEYSLEALFDKTADLTELKKAVHAEVVEKWGADKAKWPKNLRLPFKDQANKVKEVDGKEILPEAYTAGATFLSLKSKQRPGIVDQNVTEIIDASEFYAGCYARATVSVYAYDQMGNRGVNFGLMNIQKVKDGDPLGSRTKAADDFAPVALADEGVVSADDLF